MKKLGTVIAVAGLIGTPAFAADMAVKGPPPPAPAPVYNWTGFYVGGNLGASFGSAKTDFNVAPVSLGGFTTAPGFAASDTVYPSGLMGGGQIGYNWQFSPLLVAGLEADFQGADEKESATLTNPFTSFVGSVPCVCGSTSSGGTINLFATGASVTDYNAEISWFGTVRGRIGYVWGNGNVLTYVTGGLAYGEVKLDGTSLVSGNGFPPALSVTQSFSRSHVNTGWTVGYGTEGAIDFWGARNWTWKVESLYMDLGHFDAASGLIATNTHFTDWILRGGLNYKFPVI